MPEDQLDAPDMNSAWERIASHLERRYAYDLEKQGRAPRSMEQLLFALTQGSRSGGLRSGEVATRALHLDPVFPLARLIPAHVPRGSRVRLLVCTQQLGNDRLGEQRPASVVHRRNAFPVQGELPLHRRVVSIRWQGRRLRHRRFPVL